MKKILCLLAIVVSSISLTYGSEKRTYTKKNSQEASVVIITDEQDSTQAAMYVDGKENARFIDEMLRDSKSKLFKLRQAIELENCGTTSTTPEARRIDGCGEVTITKEIRTSFGRGGWASGGAGYTFFVGFTSEGSGRFFDVSHMAVIFEDVEANTKENGDYAGSVVKTLNLEKIIKLEDQSPVK